MSRRGLRKKRPPGVSLVDTREGRDSYHAAYAMGELLLVQRAASPM